MKIMFAITYLAWYLVIFSIVDLYIISMRIHCLHCHLSLDNKQVSTNRSNEDIINYLGKFTNTSDSLIDHNDI